MITFKKENGYPVTLKLITKKIEVLDECWNGFESTVYDENEKEVGKFTHATMHDRTLWVNGFFAALPK